jgi:hypothetical protein
MDLVFSLRELIVHNPHGTPPEDDWEIIKRCHLYRLADEDKRYDTGKRESIESFYDKLRFRPWT